MKQLKKILDSTVEYFTCALLAIMVVLTIWQVFTRYVLNSPSTLTTEFLRYSLIWVSLLGSAYLFGKKQHLAITFLKQKFPPKAEHLVDLFIEIMVIAFATLILTYGGIKAVMATMGQTSSSLGIPMGYIYTIIPISGILIFIYSIMNMKNLISGTKEENDSNGNNDLKNII